MSVPTITPYELLLAMDGIAHRYRLKGRTPAQALREALGIDELPSIVPAEEGATTPAA